MLTAAKLQNRLVRLLKEYSGSVDEPPGHVYSSDCHQQLTRQHVDDGVCLMSRYLGMAGSAGDIDLYRLNQAYLLDPQMRDQINNLLRGRLPS